MFDKKKLKTELLRYADAGIYKSVNRNRHMNEVEDDFDDGKAVKLLDSFVEKLDINEDETTKGLRRLVSEAKNQRRTNTVRLPQAVVDAVLVDYINFVAASYGIDYALYTRDIR